MFCPRCGQERISEETSFCSRCGFLLTGVTGLMETGGVPTAYDPVIDEKAVSPRRRGIRQGLFMFLLTFVIAPIVGLISQFGLGIEPWPVGVVIFGLGIGGLLRIAYALMFESKTPSSYSIEHSASLSNQESQIYSPARSQTDRELYPSPFAPPASSPRIETNDLQPHSVTDHTTKLLEKD